MKTDPVITKNKFRLGIIFSLIFSILSIIIDLNNEIYWQIDELVYQESPNWEWITAVILGTGLLVVLIGLLMFKYWARNIYVYMFFPCLLIYLLPSLSWTFYSGFAGIFYELSIILSTLIWGILIVPSLYQPLFEKRNSEVYEK